MTLYFAEHILHFSVTQYFVHSQWTLDMTHWDLRIFRIQNAPTWPSSFEFPRAKHLFQQFSIVIHITNWFAYSLKICVQLDISTEMARPWIHVMLLISTTSSYFTFKNIIIYFSNGKSFSASLVKIVTEYLSDMINLRIFHIPKKESKSLFWHG